MSFAPYLISFWKRGKRQTIVSRPAAGSSIHSMMSISSALRRSHSAMIQSLLDAAQIGRWRLIITIWSRHALINGDPILFRFTPWRGRFRIAEALRGGIRDRLLARSVLRERVRIRLV